MKETIRRGCINCIRTIIGDFEMHAKPKEILDDLDFVEIVMEIEREFDVRINDSAIDYRYINTMDEFIDMLSSVGKPNNNPVVK